MSLPDVIERATDDLVFRFRTRWRDDKREPLELAGVPTSLMRDAVVFLREINTQAWSLHDAMDDLIDEIERLRALVPSVEAETK